MASSALKTTTPSDSKARAGTEDALERRWRPGRCVPAACGACATSRAAVWIQGPRLAFPRGGATQDTTRDSMCGSGAAGDFHEREDIRAVPRTVVLGTGATRRYGRRLLPCHTRLFLRRRHHAHARDRGPGLRLFPAPAVCGAHVFRA